MSTTAAVLMIIFNASNWGGHGEKKTDYPTMEMCQKALSEMKVFNEKQNSGVAVVVYCAPKS